jgi:ABC-type cobalamin/Fe3+-siderophores transport system ATPase subunit
MAIMNRLSEGYDISDLSFSYGSNPCLHSLSLQLETGFFYGLIGPNWSGKTTLLDVLSGFTRPSGGSVRLNGAALDSYSQSDLSLMLATVPQSFSLNFDYTVNDVVLMGRHPHIARFSPPGDSDYDSVNNAMKTLDIYHLRQRSVRQLSGGEKQRVMIARSLAQDTPLVLLDEVTANLDINHGLSIMHTMLNLVKNNGCTIIAALHDLNMAMSFCDRLIVLKDGGLHRYGPVDSVISEDMIMDIYQVPSHIYRTESGNNHIQFKYR